MHEKVDVELVLVAVQILGRVADVGLAPLHNAVLVNTAAVLESAQNVRVPVAVELLVVVVLRVEELVDRHLGVIGVDGLGP